MRTMRRTVLAGALLGALVGVAVGTSAPPASGGEVLAETTYGLLDWALTIGLIAVVGGAVVGWTGRRRGSGWGRGAVRLGLGGLLFLVLAGALEWTAGGLGWWRGAGVGAVLGAGLGLVIGLIGAVGHPSGAGGGGTPPRELDGRGDR